MASGGMMMRLALAAFASGAAAGILLPLAFFAGGLFLTDLMTSWDAFEGLVGGLQAGVAIGLVFASPPAFFAGAAMWALGERVAAARRPHAWAAAGAAVAATLWILLQCVVRLLTDGFGSLDLFSLALLAASLPAGAGGALVFRGAMRLGDRRDVRAERRI
jgi:hypothetical protein